MSSLNSADKEKRLIKVLFWCLAAPMMVLMFLRLFFVLFQFVYGTVLVLLLGEQVERAVLIISAISTLIFTLGAIRYVYRLFKIHILSE